MSKVQGQKALKQKKKDSAEDDKAAQLAAALKRRVFDVIQQFSIEDAVSEEVFATKCRVLDKASLTEISEERSIGQICGYPRCSVRLPPHPSPQRYRIISNRVYDLQLRKFFCGDLCFSRFVHVSEQVLNEPLWIVGKPLDSDIKELHKEQRGKPGLEIYFETEEIVKTMQSINLDDQETRKGSVKEDASNSEGEGTEDLDLEDEPWDPFEAWTPTPSKIPQESKRCILIQPPPMKLDAAGSGTADLGRVSKCLTEWIRPGFLSPHQQPQMSHSESDEEEAVMDEGETMPLYQPLNEVLNSDAIRRGIVMDRLRPAWSNLLPLLQLAKADLNDALKRFLDAASFDCDNINLKVSDWKVVAVVILLILGREDAKIGAACGKAEGKLDVFLRDSNCDLSACCRLCESVLPSKE